MGLVHHFLKVTIMSIDRVDINNVLSQMRALQSQMPSQLQAPSTSFQDQLSKVQQQLQPAETQNSVDTVKATEGPSFGDMFKSAIDTVNDSQQYSKQLSQRYEQGDESVDLPEVMIALQKSSVSFQAMTQVRNKMIDAYKEIMNMPL